MIESPHYRTTNPADYGVETEDEERETLWLMVQDVAMSFGPDQMLDQLTMFANICEYRSIMLTNFPKGAWYDRFAASLRQVIHEVSTRAHAPDKKLEDKSLYFTTPDELH